MLTTRFTRRLATASVVAGTLAVPIFAHGQAAPRPGTLGPSRPAPVPRDPQPRAPGTTPGLSANPTDTSRTVALHGVVFDSLGQVPLANATVQIVSEVDRGQSFVANTDSDGRYRIPRVRAGRYLAGFFHEGIDALGIEPPPMRVMVQAGDTAARLDFAVPSARGLKAALCGPAAPGDSTGALMGVVRDAEAGTPVQNAKVVVTWKELQLTPAGLRNAHRRYPARVRANGSYIVCGLPTDGDVEANAEAPGRLGGVIELRLAARTLVRRDFMLGDSTTAVAVQLPDTAAERERRPANPITVARGSSRLSGTVRARDGRMLAGARLQVWGSGVTGQTSDNGAFALGGLPAGTYALEVRAIGYQPKRIPVDLSAKRPSSVEVVLEKQVATLASVVVTGERAKAERDMNGFNERKRTGFGRYFNEEDIENRQPFVMTDLMRMTPGMQVSPNGSFGSVVRGRGGCTPEIFIDGTRVMQGADEIDNLIRPQEVSGVEVYNSPAGVPAQFSGAAGGNCGVILIWSKRGGPAPRR